MGFSMFFCWDIMGCISWGMVIPVLVGISQITRSPATAGAFTLWYSSVASRKIPEGPGDLEVFLTWNGKII